MIPAVSPVVKVAVPVKFRSVAEVVMVPVPLFRLSPKFKVLLVRFSVAAAPKVPPFSRVKLLAPTVSVPAAAGFQAPATVMLVAVSRVKVKVEISKSLTATVSAAVKVASAVNVRSVAEEVRVPAEVSRLFPKIKVPPDTFKVPPVKVPPPVKETELAPEVNVPPDGFQAFPTDISVDVPRANAYEDISKSVMLTVPPVVMVASAFNTRFVGEVKLVPGVFRLPVRTRVLPLKFSVPPDAEPFNVMIPPLLVI